MPTLRVLVGALAFAGLVLLSGCQATDAGVASSSASAEQPALAASSGPSQAVPEAQTLKEGDVLRISFPSVPSMDTTQQVRQDGRINLPMLGEHVVAGQTTDGLTKELLELYAPKLVSKEVMVTLVSSSFSVYVTGAVLRPGKVLADRPFQLSRLSWKQAGSTRTGRIFGR